MLGGGAVRWTESIQADSRFVLIAKRLNSYLISYSLSLLVPVVNYFYIQYTGMKINMSVVMLRCCGVQSMREGVIRDVQRQEMKKIQNVKMLQDQIELTKSLKAMQQQQNTDKDSDTVKDVART